jgi:hypothetical protein
MEARRRFHGLRLRVGTDGAVPSNALSDFEICLRET